MFEVGLIPKIDSRSLVLSKFHWKYILIENEEEFKIYTQYYRDYNGHKYDGPGIYCSLVIPGGDNSWEDDLYIKNINETLGDLQEIIDDTTSEINKIQSGDMLRDLLKIKTRLKENYEQQQKEKEKIKEKEERHSLYMKLKKEFE